MSFEWLELPLPAIPHPRGFNSQAIRRYDNSVTNVTDPKTKATGD